MWRAVSSVSFGCAVMGVAPLRSGALCARLAMAGGMGGLAWVRVRVRVSNGWRHGRTHEWKHVECNRD